MPQPAALGNEKNSQRVELTVKIDRGGWLGAYAILISGFAA
jgi:hypothetical protein